MKKSIWYITKYIAPSNMGSAGSRGYLLMKEFANLGYTSVIITSDSNHLTQCPRMQNNYLVQKVDGIQLWWVKTIKYQRAKSFRRILSWIDFEFRLFFMPKEHLPKPDVIVISSLSLLTVLNGFWLRRLYGCRMIFEIRDIWPLTVTAEGGYGKHNPFVILLSWIERFGYRYSDVIVGTMPNLSEHVKNVLGFPKPVSCIPMGVDTQSLADYVAIPPDFDSKYFPNDKFIVAHVGSIGITNALDTFFESAKALSTNSKIHFLIVGDGDLRQDYHSRYCNLPNVTFAPKVPKQMVQSVLRKCDLLYFSVHSSQVWQYGQSLNKVVDYMLSGKPIVASYSGYPSMINEACCGKYVPAGDVSALSAEIVRFSEMSQTEREIIGIKGREWILLNRRYNTLAQNYISILFPDNDSSDSII